RHPRGGIIRHLKSGSKLHHKIYFWSTSTNRQRFSLLRGRVSIVRAVSPVFALFSSSCAYNLRICFTILPNFGWGTRVVVRTTIVLFFWSVITSPTRVFRAARLYFAGKGGGCAVGCRSCDACSAINYFFFFAFGSTAGMDCGCLARCERMVS